MATLRKVTRVRGLFDDYADDTRTADGRLHVHELRELLAFAQCSGRGLRGAWRYCWRPDWQASIAVRVGGEFAAGVHAAWRQTRDELKDGARFRDIDEIEALVWCVELTWLCTVPGMDPPASFKDRNAHTLRRRHNLLRLADRIRALSPQCPRLPLYVPPTLETQRILIKPAADEAAARLRAEQERFRRECVIDLDHWRRYIAPRRLPVQRPRVRQFGRYRIVE